MAGINPVQRRNDDWLSTIMKGVSIARDIYGIKATSDEAERKDASDAELKKEKNRFNAGRLNKGEQIKSGLIPGQKGPNAIPFTDDDTGEQMYGYKLSEKTARPPVQVTTVENGKKVQKFVTPKEGDVYEAYEAPTTERGRNEKTFQYKDAKGNERIGKFIGGIPTKMESDTITTPVEFTTQGSKITNPAKVAFDNLPPENQEMVRDLAKRNASKTSIANQIDALMSVWDKLPEGERIAQGEMILKTLNSLEGPDALATSDLDRLGNKLHRAYGNMTNENPARFGRDLDGFATDARQQVKNIRKAIESNAAEIDTMYGREIKNTVVEDKKKTDVTPGIGEAGAAPKVTPTAEDLKALQWLKDNPKDPGVEGVRSGLKARGLL